MFHSSPSFFNCTVDEDQRDSSRLPFLWKKKSQRTSENACSMSVSAIPRMQARYETRLRSLSVIGKLPSTAGKQKMEDEELDPCDARRKPTPFLWKPMSPGKVRDGILGNGDSTCSSATVESKVFPRLDGGSSVAHTEQSQHGVRRNKTSKRRSTNEFHLLQKHPRLDLRQSCNTKSVGNTRLCSSAGRSTQAWKEKEVISGSIRRKGQCDDDLHYLEKSSISKDFAWSWDADMDSYNSLFCRGASPRAAENEDHSLIPQGDACWNFEKDRNIRAPRYRQSCRNKLSTAKIRSSHEDTAACITRSKGSAEDGSDGWRSSSSRMGSNVEPWMPVHRERRSYDFLSSSSTGGAEQGNVEFLNQVFGLQQAIAGIHSNALPPHLLFSDRDFNEDDYEALLSLDDRIENLKGATQISIDTIPTECVPHRRSRTTELGRCPICLEDFISGELLRRLDCKHCYHKECLDRWLRTKALCPICKASVV